MRTLLHGTCETKYYADISGKPCLVEEIGTLGPMMCDDEAAANFLKLNMFSNWVNGSTGVMWWCSSDFTTLETAPYSWNMCEVELGMIDKDRRAKPVLKEMNKFSKWLETIDFELPKAKEDAVCLLTDGQDQWGVAYMSYLLAKQAKVNLKFAYAGENIPQSDVYLLPSVNSIHIMPSYKFKELKNKVYDGAVLYISNNDSIISEFSDLTGVLINDSKTTGDFGEFSLNEKEMFYSRNRNYFVTAEKARVLCCDRCGNPLITVCEYGKGKVYYVNFPLENMLIDTADAHNTELYEIYRMVFAEKIEEHIADSHCKFIGITEHTADENTAYIALINYSGITVNTDLKIKPGYLVEDVIFGDINKMMPYETTLIKLKKQIN